MSAARTPYILIPVLVISALCISSVTQAGVYNVAVVSVPPGEDPVTHFKVRRGDTLIHETTHEMKVYNGDVILPLPGKSVAVNYINSDCGSVQINEEYTISCDPGKTRTAGGFIEMLTDLWNMLFKSKMKRNELVSTRILTTRSSKDISCYPSEAIMVSPWPLDGSSILNGQPLMFRWNEVDRISCREADLVLVKQGEDNVIVIPFVVGRMNELEISFAGGTSYSWCVKWEGKTISDTHSFNVLDAERSENIELQLKEVEEAYPGPDGLLAKALYLQVISDATPGLDLYPESMRFLVAAEKEGIAIPAYLGDRLFDYCYPID